MPYEDIFFVSEEEIKKEREKARKLRRTNWWYRQKNEGVCYYCGCKVDKDELTMDHIVPLSRGGKSKKGNIVAACKSCNNKKKSMLPIEWEEYLEKLHEKSRSL